MLSIHAWGQGKWHLTIVLIGAHEFALVISVTYPKFSFIDVESDDLISSLACVCVDWATAVRNDVSLAVQVSGAGFQTAVCASTQQHSLCMVQRCCQCADSASFTLQVHFKIILDVMATTRSSIAECSEKMHILVVHRKDAYTRCSRHYTWSNFSCSHPSMFQWHSCTFGRGTVGSVPMMGSR